ncbi:MAG: nuclear transport factor 2 family protein [Actinobacteria bacterium]|nr:nuclear transport factor 2 family protein [Actinomycetota bacterium]
MTVPASPHGADSPSAVDSRFFAALVGRDRDALEELLAEDFLMVDIVAGGVVSRSALLELTESGDVSFEAIEAFPDEAVIREYGTTAVVIGRTAMRAILPGGNPMSLSSRYTHVFVQDHSGGPWQLASAQGTRIATG